MKVSYSWLQQFVSLDSISSDDLADKLTLHSCEVEEVEKIADRFKLIVTGKILEISDHPETDKLKVSKVDTGVHGERTILFGIGLKVNEGEIVPISLPGAVLPNGIEIAERKMKGLLSQGMICINSELGYKNDYLTVFPKETELGKKLSEVSEHFSDVIIDIDNKSLTHRPDMMGHLGFAREISAILQVPVSFPKASESVVSKLEKEKNEFPIKIITDGCRRFCAVKMESVLVKASPLGVQMRLENCGVRAISNLVDITNEILLEYGQPMHVFDADKVKGALIIRNAKKGETLVALDGIEYKLEETDILVTDEEKILSIAGVMGGLESSITNDTKNIVFESANFDAATIRKTSSRLGLRSDSSMRFEKTLDPETCIPAIIAAVERVQKLLPNAKIVSTISDNYNKPFKPLTLFLSIEKVRKLTGIDISEKEIERILTSLGFRVEKDGNKLEVTVPSFRSTKDVEIEEDLIEEIVRLYGFDKIVSHSPVLPVVSPRTNWLRNLEWTVRDFWSTREFFEVMNYSFLGDWDKEFTGFDNYIQIKNPLSSEQSIMRKTLLSNMIRNLESELRTHKKLNFFEVGKVYDKQKDNSIKEDLRLGILLGEIKGKENDMFYSLKKEINRFFESLYLSFDVIPTKKPYIYQHPSKSADIIIEDETVGTIFVVHPEKNDIKKASLVFAEISLSSLLPFIRKSDASFVRSSSFPSFLRDLSILVDKKTLVRDIKQTLIKTDDSVVSVELFDVFEDNERFGVGKKNLAFHLAFQLKDRTLKDEEVDASFKKMVSVLNKEFGAELRD